MRLRKEVSSDCQENVRCVGEGTWIQRILSFYPRLCTKKKQQMGQSTEAALPLESIPGIAQVDFGEAPFVYRGRSVDLSYLALSFPFSNTFYFQVFQSQNRECFLEGLKRIFHHLGGVPKTIRFDNLSPAVKKVLPYGERVLTDEFERFVLHYGFPLSSVIQVVGTKKVTLKPWSNTYVTTFIARDTCGRS